jgi:hypothetical protein
MLSKPAADSHLVITLTEALFKYRPRQQAAQELEPVKPEPADTTAAWPERGGASPSGRAGGEPGGTADPGAAGEGSADPDPGQAPGSDAEAMDVDEAAMRAGSQQVAPTAGDPCSCFQAAETSAPAHDTLLGLGRLHVKWRGAARLAQTGRSAQLQWRISQRCWACACARACLCMCVVFTERACVWCSLSVHVCGAH